MAPKVLLAHSRTGPLQAAQEDLEAAGFEVIPVSDGDEAFALFFDHSPDLVIASADLGDISGRDLVQMVHSQASDTPTLILIDSAKPVDYSSDLPTLSEPLDVDLLRDLFPQFESELYRKVGGRNGSTPTTPDLMQSSAAQDFVQKTLSRFKQHSEFLSLLNRESVSQLALVAKHRMHKDGDLIIREGATGGGFYMVVDGQVKVTLSSKDGEEVGRIGEGGFFGEMALLSDEPRSASVFSVGHTSTLYFEKEEVLPIIDQNPAVRDLLDQVARRRKKANLAKGNLQKAEKTVENSAGSPTPERVAEATVETPIPPEFRSSAKSERSRKPISLPLLTLLFVGGLAIGALFMALAMSVKGDENPARAQPPPPKTSETPNNSSPRVAAKDEKGASATTLAASPQGKESPALTEDGGVSSPSHVDGGLALEPAAKNRQARTALSDDGGVPSDPEKLSEKKRLRGLLMSAFGRGDYRSAAAHGDRLRTAHEIDWEAEFTLAEAQRNAGYGRKALQTYRSFIQRFPGNHFSDDARFRAGLIAVETGKGTLGLRLLKRVANDDSSEFQSKAEEAIQKHSGALEGASTNN